uniref:tRNA dimethylallyltransferase n=1 Tax=Lygus hesperus TaxID=30085 RepID=A0A0A9Y786_LYGHE
MLVQHLVLQHPPLHHIAQIPQILPKLVEQADLDMQCIATAVLRQFTHCGADGTAAAVQDCWLARLADCSAAHHPSRPPCLQDVAPKVLRRAINKTLPTAPTVSSVLCDLARDVQHPFVRRWMQDPATLCHPVCIPLLTIQNLGQFLTASINAQVLTKRDTVRYARRQQRLFQAYPFFSQLTVPTSLQCHSDTGPSVDQLTSEYADNLRATVAAEVLPALCETQGDFWRRCTVQVGTFSDTERSSGGGDTIDPPTSDLHTLYGQLRLLFVARVFLRSIVTLDSRTKFLQACESAALHRT